MRVPKKEMGLGLSQRRQGSGILSGEERTNAFFISTFLSLSHIKCFFSLSPELMVTQPTTQFNLAERDYITTMYVPCWGTVSPS